ncbi:iron(III) transport system substrate-binding protein [Sulfitobacter undariae]|uniref:Iron(III) transport system substrate-binding protein n=1 Tax=Sulfitobacter undariae TaxID=1563671 RepID=A0A7W6E6F2_9RHOB|nr:ABC transporter substrate-binding protein [Sulfitobacter undariae]MBB3995617.1 iron(III) transport system substrate-binding protein [Sulfitobacter undariae]
MRIIVALVLWLLPQVLVAQEWQEQQVFGAPETQQKLRIISSTDTFLFAPFVESFVSRYPEISVEYLVSETADIDHIFRNDPGVFDIVISSAMDLQLKIVNDGLAQPVANVAIPPWAQWRQSLFAFTAEPAAILINRKAFAGVSSPQTRQELIEALRARPEVFQGRIGTYDVRQSGVGYLFATQDARASETYWRLMEVMGALDVQLYCCSGEMIDDLSDGTIAVAYNVLASYAAAQVEVKDAIEIILPSDFPTTIMRTAMVSIDAPNPEAAATFIRHLVKVQSDPQQSDYPLPPLNGQGSTRDRATITMGPALMTFLDTLKRRRFLLEWENAVIQN